MSRVILHIDLNQFFVTCAQILNPSLKNKAIAIGGEGRAGIISTCSYEARKYGVHSGMPTFYAKQLCKDLIIVDVPYGFIELMSNEFFARVRKISDQIEIGSCDECYCDITKYFLKDKNFEVVPFLKKFQNNLYKETKLKCSIGVGPTKFLAKMGSDYKKPMGITIIRKKDVVKLLYPLDVGAFYGIGKKTTAYLNKIGIKTIDDLVQKLNNDEKLEYFSSDHKKYILDCLNGNTNDKLNDYTPKSHSIGTTRTLPFNTDDIDYLEIFLLNLAKKIINKMKEEYFLTKTISITYKESDCNENGFKTKTSAITFKDYTDNEEFLLSETKKLFKKSYNKKELRLIGFSVKNLKEKFNTFTQMTFENYNEHEKESETFLLVNEINRKFKKEVVKRASDIKKK